MLGAETPGVNSDTEVRMTKTLLKMVSPGLLIAIVRGVREPPVSAVVVQTR